MKLTLVLSLLVQSVDRFSWPVPKWLSISSKWLHVMGDSEHILGELVREYRGPYALFGYQPPSAEEPANQLLWLKNPFINWEIIVGIYNGTTKPNLEVEPTWKINRSTRYGYNRWGHQSHKRVTFFGWTLFRRSLEFHFKPLVLETNTVAWHPKNHGTIKKAPQQQLNQPKTWRFSYGPTNSYKI